ncbi:MAG: imidazole glycerol phosphate synthase subunit HisF, partial [Clostridiales bacterium]|nr:imidazole glycerol phosphate synthase subunit HisF [Clostridiales bacterium]
AGKNPYLISQAAERVCIQFVVLAIDSRRRTEGGFEVVVAGGRIPTGLDAIEWAREGERLGAGEILLTSMDADGTKAGFDLELTRAVTQAVRIPVIASGGCGSLSHFAEVFRETDCDAALAASLFHFGELTVPQVKEYLRTQNIPVRR